VTTDFTGAQVMAVRKSMKLSREKFAAQVGLTAAKLHNIETEKRAMRPEERTALTPMMGGAPLPTLTAVSSPPLGIFHDLYVLDEDEEAIWADSAPEVTFTPTGATQITDLIQHLSPSSTEARAVLERAAQSDGALTVAPEEPTLIGVKGLYHDGLRRVTNSELQTFKHCRRKWWLSWYRGLAPRSQPTSGPLALGTRVHEAMAMYYVPAWSGKNLSEALEELLLRDEAMLIERLAEEDAEIAAQRLTDFKKDADLARAMVEGYTQWLQETGADQGYTVIAPERTLKMIIPTPADAPDIELSGTVDVLLQRAMDNVILFMDHKTTQSFGQLTRMLLWDEQMQHYHLLSDANLGDAPRVDGALYNMMRKVKRGATAKPPFYERVEVRHNPHQLENFRDRLIGESLQIMQVENALERGVSHQHTVYPSPSARCLWGCEFSSVCPSFDDGSRAEDFIKEQYVELNPMRRYDDRQAANLVE
jgi:DNA-binding XRE family transcriptional regulator